MIFFRNLLICFFLVSIASCTENGKKQSISEGKIIFDVAFPFEEGDILQHIYPEEMVMEFKDNRVHGLLQSLGGILSSEVYIDNNSHEFDQMLRVMKDRYHLELGASGVQEMLERMPQMTLVPTDKTDSIAGYLCKMTLAEFVGDSVPSVELWHTSDINLSTPNWCNQYHDLDEVLLGYEVEQYGMRMKLRARSIFLEDIGDDVFTQPEGYTEVDIYQMDEKIRSLIEEYLGKE